MSTVEEIENAIRRLPRKDFFRLRDWVRDRFDDEWDREFTVDATAGRLNALAEQALAEFKAGQTTEFPSHEEPRNP